MKIAQHPLFKIFDKTHQSNNDIRHHDCRIMKNNFNRSTISYYSNNMIWHADINEYRRNSHINGS